jgi:ferredoxin
MFREIISIDESKCTGCGECIFNCPEGALQIVSGKAKLVGDLLCDGLGACIGHCPEGAISIEKREAEDYDERLVMENIVKEGPDVIKVHLDHLKEHGQTEYLRQAIDFLEERGVKNPLDDPLRLITQGPTPGCGCLGANVIDLRSEIAHSPAAAPGSARPTHLRHWPVQIKLVPPTAPYLKGAHILLSADCVPFAYAPFHEELLDGKILLVGCPKLDDTNFYYAKITEILKRNDILSMTVAYMEVPCCMGMVQIGRAAVNASGKEIPLDTVKIGVRGDKLIPIRKA